MDTTITVALRITHGHKLPLDAQQIADLAARRLTSAVPLVDDPQLLVTATLVAVVEPTEANHG